MKRKQRVRLMSGQEKININLWMSVTTQDLLRERAKVERRALGVVAERAILEYLEHHKWEETTQLAS